MRTPLIQLIGDSVLPPWVGRVRVPTPLEWRRDIGRDLGIDLLLKREDLIDDLGCGHKVRKLGYVVSHAKRQGATVLVTVGSVPSSQCVAVAAAARQHSMRAHLVYAGDHQMRPEALFGDYLLARLLGPSVSWREEGAWAQSHDYADRVAERERQAGEVPFVVEPGISAWPGLAGSIDLGLELAAQLPAGHLDTWVVAPAGSAGTCVGLSIASRLSGVRWRVMGICISGPQSQAERHTSILLAQAAQALGRHDLELSEVTYYEGALGRGYDQPTTFELEMMQQCLKAYQVIFDPNYMLKTFIGLQQLISTGEIPAGARVVMVHTGGTFGIHRDMSLMQQWYQSRCSADPDESGIPCPAIEEQNPAISASES